MSDLIDRQALLKQIDIDSDGEPGYYGDTWKFIDTIKSMPSAELGTNLAEVGADCISRQAAIDALRKMQTYKLFSGDDMLLIDQAGAMTELMLLPTVNPEPQWIPCSEKLPEIDQNVLLSTTAARVGTGKRLKPETIWQVTESSGEKEWVYTPEDYTDDIDSLPKAEDCAFDVFDSNYDLYVEGGLSVSSLNYKDRFEGITAWMPLPESYKGVTSIPSECEGDCGWCKPSVIEECKGVTE